MVGGLLGLCLWAAPVVFLDGSTGADDSTRAVIAAVAQGVEDRLGTAPQVVERGAGCAEGDGCVRAVEGGPRVVVRVIAAVTRTRVLLRVLDGGSAHADLGPDRATWDAELGPALALVLPAAGGAATRADGVGWGPWILAGAGVASAGAGVGFALSSAAASRDLEAGHVSADTRALHDRSAGHATVASALWVGAVIGLGSALVWAVLEP